MDIGFICRLKDLDTVPRTPFLLHRIIPIVAALKKQNHKLLIFSPKHLNTTTGMVNGYYLENDVFIKTIAPIPKQILNYYSGTITPQKRYEISYDDFKDYINENEITVYPTYDFIPFTKNKLTNFEFLSSINGELSPQTALFNNPEAQLSSELQRSKKVFLKPRSGRMGNGIIVATKKTLTYYNESDTEQFKFEKLDELIKKAKKLTQNRTYLIQQALDCLTWQKRPFTCRVSMLFDGEQWHWFHMVLLAEESSDVSNTHQGGDTVPSEKFFQRMLTDEQTAKIMNEIKQRSYQVIEPLTKKFPKTLYEVAFDFIITTDLKPQIIEINSHPGMSRPGMGQIKQLNDYLQLDEKEKALFHKRLDQYGEIVTRFLLQ